MPATTTPPNQDNPVLLHRVLGLGLVITGLALIVARGYAGDAGPDMTLFEYGLSALSAVLAGLALVVLKAQVPDRRPSQSVAAYWADPKVSRSAQLFWFILDGAGIVAAVGHFLSGGPIPAVVWLTVTGAFWMNGPSAFEDD